jgi:hypothetical protein
MYIKAELRGIDGLFFRKYVRRRTNAAKIIMFSWFPAKKYDHRNCENAEKFKLNEVGRKRLVENSISFMAINVISAISAGWSLIVVGYVSFGTEFSSFFVR